jgi:hypothetical protein
MSYYNSGILYASPGTTFEATLDSVYTGGVEGAPSFRISIIDTPTGDYYLEPTSEGIYENPEGSGIYSWSGPAPNVTGQYTIYWDDGGSPPEVYAVEDFIVTGQPLLWAAGVNAAYEPIASGQTHIVDIKNVGPPSTPQEIKRHRRQVGDMLRRFGQPVVHRHMYTLDDVDKGVAKKCPACFDDAYSQVRNDCPVCHSIGFVSVENDPERWISSTGEIVDTETSEPAPLHGGFAGPTLTMFMQPDVPIDLFKINDRGVLTRVEDAKAYTYFNPAFADNDILITVEIAQDGYTIKNILDYYQAKKANQHTVRGWGRFRSKNQNQYIVAQEFEMALVPPNNVLRNVSPGPVAYGVV